ncbi:5-formyltetrahydrofolate cyclo-ligase [Marinomonas agarivorans]|nr:5-formyltetrahydrofolate cyclo-ligase [Marinomonas agarivorans]
MTHSFSDRTTLRKKLRLQRQSLTSQAQDAAAEALLNTFLQSSNTYQPIKDLFSQSTPNKNTVSIGLYVANDGEISPSLLCEHFWSCNHNTPIRTYLPVVQGDTMMFAHYHPHVSWQENRFGIQEPIDDKPVVGMTLDIVFLPLVGFDKTGARLGMGGGFYDKAFANKHTGKRPLMIGLAHDCQQVEQIPTANWDVPLNAILTDTQFLPIN